MAPSFASRPRPDRHALAQAGRRAALAVLGLLAVTLAGTLGYMGIEGMRFLDALYMTVITLTTVGYREVQPLSDAGVWYTMALLIDPDPAAQAECEALGWLVAAGSALDDDVLAMAGITRARALVAAIGGDADNVFTALSAREHNPTLQIHARAETTEGVRRLRQAGASQLISPHRLGGARIANAIVRPGVVEFRELSDIGTAREIDLEEVRLGERSAACGVRLRGGVRVSVVAIKRGDEALRLQPGPDDELCAGDRVVALGDRENLARLAELAEG